ncbi:MAG: hypothetical protein AAFO69_15855, partial [Bacteroidota bacterium]
NTATAAINATVENSEKWQKLTMKLIKKSEPIRRKQMDIVFDTAEAVKNQVVTGTERAMDLVEFEQAMEFAKNNPVSQKVVTVADDLKEVAGTIKNKVNENPVVQQLNKTSENLRTKGTAKLNDIKEDVLEQAQAILNKGEKMVEGALTTNDADKSAKVTAKTKAVAKKTVKAVAIRSTAKATSAKPATKATAAKATTAKRTTKAATAKSTTKAKASVAKATENAKAAPVKAEATADKK